MRVGVTTQAWMSKQECGTLKRDQWSHMNHCTAGVNAGVYNCGIACKISVMWSHESNSAHSPSIPYSRVHIKH